MANEITMYRGDNRTLQVTVKDADGVAVGLTNYTAKFTVRTKPDTDTVTIAKTTTLAAEIDITDPTNGILEIYIVPADTKDLTPRSYDYDVEITSATSIVSTVVKSTFTIQADISHS